MIGLKHSGQTVHAYDLAFISYNRDSCRDYFL